MQWRQFPRGSDGVEEFTCVAVSRGREHLLDGAFFDDLTAFEDDNSVGDACDHAKVVRDEQERQTKLVANPT